MVDTTDIIERATKALEGVTEALIFVRGALPEIVETRQDGFCKEEYNPALTKIDEAIAFARTGVPELVEEVRRLREPPGDHKELVDRLNERDWGVNVTDTLSRWDAARKEAAAYIERQAAELARLREPLGDHKELVERLKAENERMKAALTVLRLRKLIIKTDKPNRVKLPDDMGGDWIEGTAADFIYRAFGMIDDVATNALAAPSSAPVDAGVEELAAWHDKCAAQYRANDWAKDARKLADRHEASAQTIRTLSRQLTSVSEEDVEKAARVIQKSDHPHLDWVDFLPKHQDRYRKMARAALTAFVTK